MLVFGLVDGRVMLVDEATGEEKWAVDAHTRYPEAHMHGSTANAEVAMSPDGRFVASVGLSEPWKLWDAGGELPRVGAMHDGSGACICPVNDLGRRVLQAGCPVVAHTGGLRAVAFSPCGQRFATGGEDGAVIVWDVQKGEAEHRMIEGDPKMVSALSFSATGERLASGGGEGSICVWVTATGALLFRMHEEDDLDEEVESLHFSPTGKKQLVSATETGVSMWDVEKGEKMWETAEGFGFAVFSPDGRTIATATFHVVWHASHDCVHLLNAATGESMSTMVVHQQVHCAAFCGAAFEDADEGGAAFEDGEAFEDDFSDDDFFEDGGKLASCSHDGTCKVWDSSTAALLRTINIGTTVHSVAWGRDWVGVTQSAMAFAMGHHPRLGAGSWVLELEVGVVRMILDRV